MTNFGRWLTRRVGRRNLPFLAAVAALVLVVIVLMVYSPRTDNGATSRPPLVSTE